MTISFEWDVPPAALVGGFEAYVRRVHAAVAQTAQLLAPRLEAYARSNARWSDRTGNARSGLVSSVEVADELVTLYLAHAMNYGVFLELARGGQYAILWESIEAVIPEIWSTLRGLLT